MTRNLIWRCGVAALLLSIVGSVLLGSNARVAGMPNVTLPNATPAVDPCAGFPIDGTPVMDNGAMAGMDGTPMPGMDHDMPGEMVAFDQMYIDMMIPHHASIIAMAEAALTRLTDERLRAMAEAIVAAQEAEIEELRDYREQFYGDPDPMPMDHAMMTMMDEMMPGMAESMAEKEAQMDAARQVELICTAADPDLAFIDLTIPHHISAIVASEAALEQAIHPEIEAFAERVIEDQQREIDELTEIREELYGSATPEAVGS